jgi:hypothetical protein
MKGFQIWILQDELWKNRNIFRFPSVGKICLHLTGTVIRPTFKEIERTQICVPIVHNVHNTFLCQDSGGETRVLVHVSLFKPATFSLSTAMNDAVLWHVLPGCLVFLVPVVTFPMSLSYLWKFPRFTIGLTHHHVVTP